MQYSLPSLSIVLPAYNEEDSLPQVISSIHAFATQVVSQVEIIVVDDGSQDRTPVILTKLQKATPQLKVIRHEHNKGYGEALRSGFNAATMKWILLMDSDGQFHIQDVERFLPYINTYTCIIGYREKRSDRFIRTLGAQVYRSILAALFDLRVKDVGCGFKLFQRSLWEHMDLIQAHDHKIFTVEFLLKIKQRNIPIQEVSIPHYSRTHGKQTGARLDVVLSTVKELIRLKFQPKAHDQKHHEIQR